MSKILICDDDKELCQLIVEYMQSEGFDADCRYDGMSAIEAIETGEYDLLVLDVMMPGKNGFETLQQLRGKSQLPVIMMTAKGEKIDRIVGLEMGADDYVAKPCDPRELVARIRAIMRRTNGQNNQSQPPGSIVIDDVELHFDSRQVLVAEQELEMTSTEFDCLAYLMQRAGQLVSRQELSEKCLHKKLQTFDRSIDMHISNIRKKLGLFQQAKTRIKTIRNSGYQYLVWEK